jgi:hypothetical protein
VPASSFDQLLVRYIAEVSDNGFVTMERIVEMMISLSDAARAQMRSEVATRDMMTRGLTSIYERLVERHGVMRNHPGLPRFTLENMQPHLRAMLGGRILASASLIKLQREQAISKTLQRFSGWATSVPMGGSSEVDRREVRATVAKEVRNERFREQRVLIDQGHKLRSAIDDVVAQDGGAIAEIWRSNWRQKNYNYREDHKDRDGEVYLLRRSWARDAGFVKPGKAGFSDDITRPGEEVFCRCYCTFLYHLRQLPKDMLTAKGVAELQRVRALINAA